MTKIISLCQQIASEISSIENRERKRSAGAQKHFEHVIECLLKDLWLGTAIHPEYEVGIHRRSNWYSETPQYRDPKLTYPQAIAAYDGMIAIDLIRVTRNGFYDRDTGRSDVTKVIATDKLLQVLEGLDGNPFKEVEPDLESECILLRDRINDQRVLVPYDNDKTTNEMRENLIIINKCFAPIVVEFHVSSIFSYTPTLRMKIDRFDWGLKLTSKVPDPRPKRLEPPSSGQIL